MKNIFDKVNPFRNNKKAEATTAATSKPADISNIIDILGDSDVAAVDTLIKAGINLDTEFNVALDGQSTYVETVGVMAAKALYARIEHQNQAISDLQIKNGNIFAAMDRIAEHAQHKEFGSKYARAAIFLHSEEFLASFIPKDSKHALPAFTYTSAALEELITDNSVVETEKAHIDAGTIVAKLAGVNDPKKLEEISEKLAQSKQNSLQENSAQFYNAYCTIMMQPQSQINAQSVLMHTQEAAAARSVLKEGGTQDEMLEWANDPYLQYHYRFLGDVPGATQYSDEFFKQFENMLQQEKNAAQEAHAAEQQKQQELWEELNATVHAAQNAIKSLDVETAQKLFKDQIDPNFPYHPNDAEAPATFTVLAARQYSAFRAVIAPRKFEERIVSTFPQTLEAMDAIDDINDFGMLDDAMILLHEDVLDYLNVEKPDAYISATCAMRAAETIEELGKTEQIMRAVLHIDEGVSIEQTLEQLSRTNVYANEAHQKIKTANQSFDSWEPRYVLDALAKTHNNAQAFLKQSAEAIAENIARIAQNPELVKKLPFLKDAAALITTLKAKNAVEEQPAAQVVAQVEDVTPSVAATVVTAAAESHDHADEGILAYTDDREWWKEDGAVEKVFQEEKVAVCNSLSTENGLVARMTHEKEFCKPLALDNGIVLKAVKAPAA